LRRLAIGWRTQSWLAHSRLFVAGDGNRWAIADDAFEVARIAESLGIRVGPERWIARVRNQSIFHTSQFTLIGLPFERHGNRLGVYTVRFRPRDPESRVAARRELGLPESAFVVGSFQKDGVGWGDGLQPKLIKGPDVLLDVAERLRREVPELVVLLTGPARGYVEAGLERLGVPCRRALLPALDAVARA